MVNPTRLSLSFIVSPLCSAEALTHRTEILVESKDALFFLGWKSQSLEELLARVAENDVVAEWFGVRVRGSSITEQKKKNKNSKYREKIKAGADDDYMHTRVVFVFIYLFFCFLGLSSLTGCKTWM